jgi:hypothetical protein
MLIYQNQTVRGESKYSKALPQSGVAMLYAAHFA